MLSFSGPSIWRTFFVLVCGILMVNSSLSAQKSDFDKSALAQSIDSLLEAKAFRPFNGVIQIEQDGKPIYQKRQGYADLETKQRFGKHTQFVIGSLSKQITAVILLRTKEKGLLEFHVGIGNYLPELKQAWRDSVTIHHLLNHTSGIKALDAPLVSTPGTQFAYSNLAYALLGQILEKVNHQSFAYQAQALFRECGMKHSATPETGKLKWLPKGWFKNQKGDFEAVENPFIKNSIPAGLMVSTAADLSEWNALLHSGKLLQKESYDEFTKASSTRDHPIFGDVDYAYGIQMTHLNDLFEVSHGGYVKGFVAVNFYQPATKLSLIVLENYDWMDPTYQETFWFEMQIRKVLRNWVLRN